MSRQTILVIDDEDGVRGTICENLSACGFQVMEAADGQEGMGMIDPACPPFLLITDIIMPRQEGLETIIQIKKTYPAVKVIAISGGGRAKTMDFLDLARKLGADVILPKPLDIDELEQAVRKLTA